MKIRKNSIRRYMLLWGIGISSMILVSLLGFGTYLFVQYRRTFIKEHKALTQEYAESLSRDIVSLEDYIWNVYGENAHYQILRRTQITEKQWILSTYYLKNSFGGKAGNLDFPGGVFYYDPRWDALRSEFGANTHSGDSFRLNESIKDAVRDFGEEKNANRSFLVCGDDTYLLYVLEDNDRILGYIVALSRYYTLPEGMQLVIADSEGNILVDQGDRILEQSEVEEELWNTSDTRGLIRMIAREALTDWDLRLMLIHQDNSLAFWKSLEFRVVFLMVPVVVLLLFWYMYRYMKRILYYPIDYIMRRLDEMKNGVSGEDLPNKPESGRLEEYEFINRRLDGLLEEMRRMEQEKFEKETEANAALLQYYQLQMRPHFFLNCLNILGSLLDDKDVSAMKTMIYSLSRHMRYIFRDTESQVTLAEELDEVREYCNIFMISRSVPVLLQLQANSNVRASRVPILCIQTFVENSLKHAVEKDQILSVTVKADRIKDSGQKYLKIRIEDNGPGYPACRLEQLNRPITAFQYRSEQVGVDNIKYRIYLLYGDSAKICFYNNTGGGAVVEILLPGEENEYPYC